jgi:hypothetical protein
MMSGRIGHALEELLQGEHPVPRLAGEVERSAQGARHQRRDPVVGRPARAVRPAPRIADHLEQLALDLPLVVAWEDARGRAEHLLDRARGDLVAVGQAAALEHEAVLVADRVQELVHQA